MTTSSITLIAALDSHRAIGRGNTLPWRIPEDLKRFKALSKGKPVIMGRKTAESLGRALPLRTNIVISRKGTLPFEGMLSASTAGEALRLAGDAPEVVIIGGGQIYSMFMPIANRLRLTWVDTVVPDADAFFPAVDMRQWTEVFRENHSATPEQPLSFHFVDYDRRS